MATEADFRRIGNYARMYNPDQGIDRRNAKRTVPMQVLCLGYSRTGTLSMRKALEVLGYPEPYHFSSQYDNVRDCDLWLEAINVKFHGKEDTIPDWKVFFDGLLGHCGAVTDAPCMLFSKELIECYPDAKIVLVERDIESWYKSWMSFCVNAYDPVIHFLGKLDPYSTGKIAAVGDRMMAVLTGFADTLPQARVRSRDAYRHHYRDVRELVPADRLLDFNLRDGWQPLCQFLGKPVPVSQAEHLVRHNQAASVSLLTNPGRAVSSRERKCQ